MFIYLQVSCCIAVGNSITSESDPRRANRSGNPHAMALKERE